MGSTTDSPTDVTRSSEPNVNDVPGVPDEVNCGQAAGMSPPTQQWHQLQALLDKQAIRETLMRYARGMDRHWPELANSAYHHDSWDYHGSFTGRGREFTVTSAAATRRADPQNQMTHHLLGQTYIELAGDTGLCETYFHCAGIHNDDDTPMAYHIHGRYLDRVERVGEEWKIRVRRVIVDMSSQGAAGAAWSSAEHYPRGERWPKDAVFRFEEMVSFPTSTR